MSKAQAWSAYWKQMGEAGGCLPGAPPAVDAQLTELWTQFARRFDRGAKLLDLACGTGAVMRALLRGNGDLDLTGVDYAELPKSRSKKTKLVGSTDIANLPFDDERFDGLTSQFGIEYADVAAAAPEIARVAKADAMVQFIVHHADSPIVEQNRNRHAALNAIARSSIRDMARRATSQPGSDTAMLSQTFSLIARSHPDQPVVREIAAAIDHAVRFGGAGADKELDRIEASLEQEIAVLSALLDVALGSSGVAEFTASLAAHFDSDAARPIQIQGLARPIAWSISARRKA
ncbi:class I SAM-dependent methyltransferase [Parasphingopyxis sp.]|uniref:class I SAM-dependent methyltransferase n=1 Tax=Parasphingopyxis sp. TaxID=1920299 RepID=UPI00261E624B|nr:class I SAM-dependent methyltransferase [Parasphingopyxis sp.]